MKAKETINKYRSMKPLELEKELLKQNKDYAILKLNVSGKKHKDFSVVAKYKKNISRLLTIQNESKEK